MSWLRLQRAAVLAATVAACGLALASLALASPASVAGAGGWKVRKSPNPGGCCSFNLLAGVAAASPTHAWAVGQYSNGTASPTLIERWNGKAWRAQKSPNPGGPSDDYLAGVAAASPTSAWAVGAYYDGTAEQTLVEHWNGRAWKVQGSPNPGGSSETNWLVGVAAASPEDAWAVGYYDKGSVARTLVEHWNGYAWKVQKSPNLGGSGGTNALESVSAISPTAAWAVGYYSNGTAGRTLVERWNGKAWKVQKSPNPGGSSAGDYLGGVVATSRTTAWAVGDFYNGIVERTLVERWNGKAWKVQKSPNPSTSENQLTGVTATSPTNAWAAGYYNRLVNQTLIEHWNGKAWKVQKSPNPGGSGADNSLAAIAATSASNAWAVGGYSNGTAPETLIEHWG